MTFYHKDNGGPFWKSPHLHGLLIGHRGFGYASNIVSDPKMHYIVVLREPVSRIISLFDYAMHSTHFKNGPQKWWGDSKLEDVLLNHFERKNASSIPHRFMERWLVQQVEFMCGYDCVRLIPGRMDMEDTPRYVYLLF